jgi:hypothetical protein
LGPRGAAGSCTASAWYCCGATRWCGCCGCCPWPSCSGSAIASMTLAGAVHASEAAAAGGASVAAHMVRACCTLLSADQQALFPLCARLGVPQARPSLLHCLRTSSQSRACKPPDMRGMGGPKLLLCPSPRSSALGVVGMQQLLLLRSLFTVCWARSLLRALTTLHTSSDTAVWSRICTWPARTTTTGGRQVLSPCPWAMSWAARLLAPLHVHERAVRHLHQHHQRHQHYWLSE